MLVEAESSKGYLPLVVIELRAWHGDSEAILIPSTVVVNEGLDVAGPVGMVAGEPRSEPDWKASVATEAGPCTMHS